MLEVEELWVGKHTRQFFHLGTTTTNRVEGAHANIKKSLSSSGTLVNAIKEIDRHIRSQVHLPSSVIHEPLIQMSTNMILRKKFQALL